MIDDGRPWRGLGAVLGFGAAYDGVFAIAILFFTVPAAALLRLQVPDDRVYLHLTGVLLGILAAIYSLAAREPRRYAAIAPVSAVGRMAGFALFALAWSGGRPATLLALGIADLLIAAATLVAWRLAARAR